jgi:hypothetical protein
LAGKRPCAPQGQIFGVGKAVDLPDQLVTQRDRGLKGEQRFWLPRLVDRAIGRFMAVLGASCGLTGGGGLGKIGRIQIVLAGNADQGKQGIAPGIGSAPRPSGAGKRLGVNRRAMMSEEA